MISYGIILAGGGGTRFWPLSRINLPKQFLNLSGKEIMVNETIDRIKGSIEPQNIFVVTNEDYKELTKDLTKGRINEEHILGEPAARNTAACIGYAAMELIKKHGDGIMCVLPSDHYIENLEGYNNVLKLAVNAAEEEDCLVTIGVCPSYPSTGYGYIKYGEYLSEKCARVLEFVEKPNLETAESYLSDGGYLWNSGIFVWKASVILSHFQKLLPDIYECLEEIGSSMGTDSETEVINRVYPDIPKISIDYGIMERAKNVKVIEGDFGWNDVGSWDSLKSLSRIDKDGNQKLGPGNPILMETKNCIVYSKQKKIVVMGAEDLIIVETDDVVMVCRKDKAQDVKDIVEELKARGEEEYL